MTNSVQSIALELLLPHPDNPNRQSRAGFAKLVRNIERTGRYEPIVVRPQPDRTGYFQIINGYHRCKALAQLDYERADAIVWDIDDEQTDILLATLNRLGGSDELAKKLALLKRLNKSIESDRLSKLLPQTAKQIERLTNLKMPNAPARQSAGQFASSLVFFLTDTQRQIVENAFSLVKNRREGTTKAAKRAAVLTQIAQYFLKNSNVDSGSSR